MPRLRPDTFANRYTDFNAAAYNNHETVIRLPEVRTKIQPHYRDAWTDDTYRDMLTKLSNGEFIVDGADRVIRATKPAQKAIQSMLMWEGVMPAPTVLPDDALVKG